MAPGPFWGGYIKSRPHRDSILTPSSPPYRLSYPGPQRDHNQILLRICVSYGKGLNWEHKYFQTNLLAVSPCILIVFRILATQFRLRVSVFFVHIYSIAHQLIQSTYTNVYAFHKFRTETLPLYTFLTPSYNRINKAYVI